MVRGQSLKKPQDKRKDGGEEKKRNEKRNG